MEKGLGAGLQPGDIFRASAIEPLSLSCCELVEHGQERVVVGTTLACFLRARSSVLSFIPKAACLTVKFGEEEGSSTNL